MGQTHAILKSGYCHLATLVIPLQEVERSRLLDRVRLGHATQTMDTNPIKTAIMVCSELIQRKVSGRAGENETGMSCTG